MFTTAYRQLSPAEKLFADGYVASVEHEANRRNERISLALARSVTPSGMEMLDRPMVCAAIAERIKEIAAATELTHHRVIKEYMAMGFSSMGDYMEIGQDGQPYFDLARCTPEQLSAIQSVEIEETHGRMGVNRKFKFKLHPKQPALQALAEHMGLLQADNPVWRASNAQPVTALPATTTVDAAADQYARLING